MKIHVFQQEMIEWHLLMMLLFKNVVYVLKSTFDFLCYT